VPGLEELCREELLAVVKAQAVVVEQQAPRPVEQAARIEALTARVADLTRRLGQNSGNSSLPPSSDRFGKPSRDRRKPSPRKPGKQPGATGSTLGLVADPDEVVEHAPAASHDCGNDLAAAELSATVVRQVRDIPLVKVRVTEHRIHKRACGCGAVTAAAGGGRAGGPRPEPAGHRGVPGGRDQPSTRRDQAVAARRADRESDRLPPPPLPRPTAVEEFGGLPSYAGTIVRDALTVYDAYPATHALCGAHLIRELTAVAEAHPDRIWPGQARSALADLATAARTARDAGLTRIPPGQAAQPLRLFRHAVLVGLAEHRRAEGRKQSKARNRLERLRDREPEILRFTKDLAVPFTNNGSERDLRPVKTQVKISGCHRATAGAQARLRIRGYISTVRKHADDVLTALHDAITGNPWHQNQHPQLEWLRVGNRDWEQLGRLPCRHKDDDSPQTTRDAATCFGTDLRMLGRPALLRAHARSESAHGSK
jgi:hypothetical protein